MLISCYSYWKFCLNLCCVSISVQYSSTFYYFFSHRWNYWLAGGLHPFGFHVVNIILHGVVSVILLWVASVCFCGQLSEFWAPRASLLCALLFAVHPIHAESVSTKLLNFYAFRNVFMTAVKAKYSV